MASYQHTINRAGRHKVKAVARVWMDGKQCTRSKTFAADDELSARNAAEAWGKQAELQMRTTKARALYGATGRQNRVPDVRVSVGVDSDGTASLGEIIRNHQRQIEPLLRHLDQQSVFMLNVSTLIQYFMVRAAEKATLNEIEQEKTILKDLLSQMPDSGSKRANIVGLAFQAACADGACFDE